ncbi:flavin reductase [Rhodoferax sp. TH121]|uniref:flavin reductase family protein n=1 Tax=Rhodoferax sp. TH121 TaxID=2022803 RepID=UPI000B96867E|nr:flavin reductase family protein [Rhodoferax sp. TH121]OYQ39208.1 flavin reductase [Rhodoferax sp. TH121]
MTTLPAFCTPVPLDKAYRLLNHGPTVLVSSSHAGEHNVMAAAWSMPLDFSPPKVTVVIDKATHTRALMEGSGWFALNVPARGLAQATLGVGSDSAASAPDKLQRHGIQLFQPEGCDVPLVQDCVGWLLCKLVPEPHNQQTYDLFIGEVTQAWADARVFVNGHWEFDKAPDDLRTLHYVAGGQFFVIGDSLKLKA